MDQRQEARFQGSGSREKKRVQVSASGKEISEFNLEVRVMR